MGYFLCVILVCGGKKSDNAGGKKSDNAGRKTAGEKDVTTEKIQNIRYRYRCGTTNIIIQSSFITGGPNQHAISA